MDPADRAHSNLHQLLLLRAAIESSMALSFASECPGWCDTLPSILLDVAVMQTSMDTFLRSLDHAAEEQAQGRTRDELHMGAWQPDVLDVLLYVLEHDPSIK